jgi:dTDP-glucose 4,6-dehydratase
LVSDADVVVHFAAETHVPRSLHDTLSFFETDVMGTQSVVSAVLKHPLDRFIHISSSEAYGTAAFVPMTEEHPLNPTTPMRVRRLGPIAWSILTRLRMVCLPHPAAFHLWPASAFGKGDPAFHHQRPVDEPLIIHGDGRHSRDWVYVEDLCHALDRAIHTDCSLLHGEAINLGTGVETPILAIAELILDLLGKPRSLITFAADRPGQVLCHLASADKAYRLLGWKATTKLADGMVRTIRWYADHSAWWQQRLWMRAVTITDSKGRSSMY